MIGDKGLFGRPDILSNIRQDGALQTEQVCFRTFKNDLGQLMLLRLAKNNSNGCGEDVIVNGKD